MDDRPKIVPANCDNDDVPGTTSAYLSYGELSARTGLSLSTLRRRVKDGSLPCIQLGGPRSREFYKQSGFPNRYQGRLPLAWSSGDDYIYSVPARATGLASLRSRS